jgi:hypothetical protein
LADDDDADRRELEYVRDQLDELLGVRSQCPFTPTEAGGAAAILRGRARRPPLHVMKPSLVPAGELAQSVEPDPSTILLPPAVVARPTAVHHNISTVDLH